MNTTISRWRETRRYLLNACQETTLNTLCLAVKRPNYLRVQRRNRGFWAIATPPAKSFHTVIKRKRYSSWTPFSNHGLDSKKGVVSNASRRFAEQANQSVADTKKNDREEGKQASAFVASWLQVRDALLQQPIGLFKSQHWMEAELLITNLRNHTAFVKEGHISPQERIESMFLVLDRLCREISQSPTITSRDPRNMSIVTNAVLPLDSGILVAVLVSWRDFLFSTVNLISRSSNAGPSKKSMAPTVA